MVEKQILGLTKGVICLMIQYGTWANSEDPDEMLHTGSALFAKS